MRLKIEFFEGRINDAVGAGIYGMYLSKNNQKQLLYIGESSSVIVRASQHLLALRNDPTYRGLTDETINDPSLILTFELLQTSTDEKPLTDRNLRKAEEKKLIRKAIESSDERERPLLQNGISDRAIKNREDRVTKVNEFLRRGEHL